MPMSTPVLEKAGPNWEDLCKPVELLFFLSPWICKASAPFFLVCGPFLGGKWPRPIYHFTPQKTLDLLSFFRKRRGGLGLQL